MKYLPEEIQEYRNILNNIGNYKILSKLVEQTTPVAQPAAPATPSASQPPANGQQPAAQEVPEPKPARPGQYQYHRGDLGGMPFGKAFKDSRMRGYDSFYWNKNGKIGEYETILKGETTQKYLQHQEKIRKAHNDAPIPDTENINSDPSNQAKKPDEKKPDVENKANTPGENTDTNKVDKPAQGDGNLTKQDLQKILIKLKAKAKSEPPDPGQTQPTNAAIRYIDDKIKEFGENPQLVLTKKNVIDELGDRSFTANDELFDGNAVVPPEPQKPQPQKASIPQKGTYEYFDYRWNDPAMRNAVQKIEGKDQKASMLTTKINELTKPRFRKDPSKGEEINKLLDELIDILVKRNLIRREDPTQPSTETPTKT